MTSGYHNSLAPFLVCEIQSQYHMYSMNINHSHRCTNKVMFTAVKDALTNKPTVEMELDVPVRMDACHKTVNSISYRYCQINWNVR
jgi:hypothetical protein